MYATSLLKSVGMIVKTPFLTLILVGFFSKKYSIEEVDIG
jgi:hypothetical protein